VAPQVAPRRLHQTVVPLCRARPTPATRTWAAMTAARKKTTRTGAFRARAELLGDSGLMLLVHEHGDLRLDLRAVTQTHKPPAHGVPVLHTHGQVPLDGRPIGGQGALLCVPLQDLQVVRRLPHLSRVPREGRRRQDGDVRVPVSRPVQLREGQEGGRQVDQPCLRRRRRLVAVCVRLHVHRQHGLLPSFTGSAHATARRRRCSQPARTTSSAFGKCASKICGARRARSVSTRMVSQNKSRRSCDAAQTTLSTRRLSAHCLQALTGYAGWSAGRAHLGIA
jgi:hypothetical protein